MKESDLYNWPSPYFPFRKYLDHQNCRIFIIENIEHNYRWMKEVKNEIKETDYFLVIGGWFFDEAMAKRSAFAIKSLGININQFFMLFNSLEENVIGMEYGFNGDLINHNAWLDERKFKLLGLQKKYDALYIARRSAFKRHFLCSNIQNLALAAGGGNHGKDACEIPKSINDASKMYNRDEIVTLINESSCGLCLSEVEGACFSSSEYLLCGTPVVSTQSQGGRDFWYNIENSIITEADPEDVAKAVSRVKSKYFNPKNIRSFHIKQMMLCRIKFIKALSDIFERHKVEINPQSFFEDFFYEKMRKSKHRDEVVNIFKN